MRSNKAITIMIMLMSGFVSPIVFFYAQYAGGEAVQASVVSIKATITFLSGLLMIGYDKSYSYHYVRGEREGLASGFILVLYNFIFALFVLLGLFIFTNDYQWLAVAVGIVGSAFFYISRSYSVSINNLSLVNVSTLLYYLCNIVFLFLVEWGEVWYFVLFNGVWLFFALLLLYKKRFFSIFFQDKEVRNPLATVGRFKFGLGDFSAGLSVSAPVFFVLQAFEFSGEGSYAEVVNIGFIFLLVNMMRYPVSALLPLVVASRIEESSYLSNPKKNSFGGIVLCFCLMLSLLVFLKVIFNLFELQPYSLVRNNLFIVSGYISLSFIVFVFQYFLLLKGGHKVVNFVIYSKLVGYFIGICFVSYFFQISFVSIMSVMLTVELSAFIWLCIGGIRE